MGKYLGLWSMLIFCGLVVNGQPAPKKDTTQNNIDIVVPIEHLRWTHIGEPDDLQVIDTTIQGFQWYNPAYKQPYDHLYLGNLGTATRPLVYEPSTNIGFDLGFHAFDIYRYRHQDLKFYNTRAPLTNLYYVQGLSKEQLFEVMHTQNITPNFSAGVNVRYLASTGLYQNQKANHANVAPYIWYRSPNKRYNIMASAIYNKFKVDENGGVQDITLFEQDLFSKTTADVNIQDVAVSVTGNGPARNLKVDNDVMVVQSWDWGRHYSDSINDSTAVKKFFGKTRLTHTFQVFDRMHVYRDNLPNGALYDTVYVNTNMTFNRIYHQQFNNRLAFEYLGVKSQTADTTIYGPVKATLFVGHEWFNLAEEVLPVLRPLRAAFNKPNYLAGGRIFNNPKSAYKLLFDVGGTAVVDGFNAGNYNAQAKLGWRISDTLGLVYGFVHVRQQRSVYLAERLYSNNFIWDQTWQPIYERSTGVVYANPAYHFEVGGQYGAIDNLMYWDEKGFPQQHTTAVQRVRFHVHKGFHWRNFHFLNWVVYQQFSDTLVAHFPKIWTKHSWFYERDMFKSAIHAQLGFDVRFMTDYYADGYMPATGQFTTQNSNKMAYYPVVDMFFAFNVQKAQIFLMGTHLTQDLLGKGYFGAYRYPMPDRGFKFGVSWRFIN